MNCMYWRRCLSPLILVALLTAGLWPAPQPLHAQTTNAAGVVVVFGNGTVIKQCVPFDTADISGYELLTRAMDRQTPVRFPVYAEISGTGTSICAIGNAGDGCFYPSYPCFCNCTGADCRYWSYWQLLNGVWTYSNTGAGATRVSPGQVQGWVYGPGSVTAATPPPQSSYQEICAIIPSIYTPMPTPTLLLTPTPTWTPVWTPTWTPMPMVQPPPTNTYDPFAVPVAPTVDPLTLTGPQPSATPVPPPLPVIDRFTLDSAQVTAGDPLMASWVTRNGEQITLRSATGDQPVQGTGTLALYPAVSQVIAILVRNQYGQVEAQLPVVVLPAPPGATPAAVALAQPPSPLADPAAASAAPLPPAPVTEMPTVAPVVTETPTPAGVEAVSISGAQLAPTLELVLVEATLAPVALVSVTPAAVADASLAGEASAQTSGGAAAPDGSTFMILGFALVMLTPVVILGAGLLLYYFGRNRRRR
jgi:hypothetical protein